MADRNRSLIPWSPRDVTPTRPSASRGVVQSPQSRVPDRAREYQRPDEAQEVIPAPDLNWRFVSRDERRNMEVVPSSRRDIESWDDGHRHYPDRYEEHDHPDGYHQYHQPVRYRHRADANPGNISIHLHVNNHNETHHQAGGNSDVSSETIVWFAIGILALFALITVLSPHGF